MQVFWDHFVITSDMRIKERDKELNCDSIMTSNPPQRAFQMLLIALAIFFVSKKKKKTGVDIISEIRASKNE
jgi:hypothetical protein